MPVNQDLNAALKSLPGTWKLVRTEAFDADGNCISPPYGGEKAMGLVSFNRDNRMIAVLCDSHPDTPPGLEREFVSYCGNYSFDGEHLITQVDASSRQAWFGTEQIRHVSFENELLVLRPPRRAYAGAPEQRVLYWQRLA